MANEITSLSARHRDFDVKRKMYAQKKVPYFIIVDEAGPEPKTVYVYISPSTVRYLFCAKLCCGMLRNPYLTYVNVKHLFENPDPSSPTRNEVSRQLAQHQQVHERQLAQHQLAHERQLAQHQLAHERQLALQQQAHERKNSRLRATIDEMKKKASDQGISISLSPTPPSTPSLPQSPVRLSTSSPSTPSRRFINQQAPRALPFQCNPLSFPCEKEIQQ